MKNRILSLGMVALALTASSAAYAGVRVDVNPFGWWGPPPPVVYVGPGYYGHPADYYGRGHYGDRHDSRGRYDRGHDRRR